MRGIFFASETISKIGNKYLDYFFLSMFFSVPIFFYTNSKLTDTSHTHTHTQIKTTSCWHFFIPLYHWSNCSLDDCVLCSFTPTDTDTVEMAALHINPIESSIYLAYSVKNKSISNLDLQNGASSTTMPYFSHMRLSVLNLISLGFEGSTERIFF